MPRQSLNRATMRRASVSLVDVAWWLLFLLLLIGLLLPSMSRSRELAKRAACASNLRGVVQGMHIYANDYVEWFPIHYFSTEAEQSTAAPQGIAHRYLGTMGSHDFLRISQATSKEVSPTRSHTSRSLFLMVVQGQTTPGMFLCPSSGDFEDLLRNSGADAGGKEDAAAAPGITRFDFRGYHTLSYGYQMPFGRRAKPRTAMDVRVAIAADKGPYFAAGLGGLDGTVDDAAVPGDGAPRGLGDTVESLVRAEEARWRPYNSRSHGGEGQNVAFVDGHADFLKKPIAGVNLDNIYTLGDDYFAATSALIGRDPGEDGARYGPLTNTDSVIIP